MLDSGRASVDRPVVFCLHYLGGSGREWSRVAALLQRTTCVPVDLPGFGDAANEPGHSVADMADHVARAIRARAPSRWTIAGHSMGAKVAAVLARRAEDGAPELAGLEGLVLIAGSPPSPEPMPEKQRRTMLDWFAGDSDLRLADARAYVAQNHGDGMDEACIQSAVADAVRADRAAWTAWLERGSREDWSDRVGRLRTPTLVLAGEADENLGPSAQRAFMLPHFEDARMTTLSGAKHLLPMERPEDVARALDDHATFAPYRALVASNRVGAKTREALRARERPDDPAYEPAAMDADALATLRAVVDRVIPQDGAERIDLAARIDALVASGAGDGWRFAILPPDAEAYRVALATLTDGARRETGRAFCELDDRRQDELLARVADGRFGEARPQTPATLDAAQMRAWFEDVRAEAVKAYMGHPRTLARIGYGGVANGGDGEPKTGFSRVGLGEREPWEPQAMAEGSR